MKIIKKGWLDVSKAHSLYYELCGSPSGVPIIFIHGGPGFGFSDKDKIFFDSKKHQVLFFDQRGSGRSRPFACTDENTIQDLSEDLTKLMDFVGWKKAVLFGGSWGSTLALYFAINFPSKVSRLVLRGIFLGREEDNEFYLGEEKKLVAPKAWLRMAELVPQDMRSGWKPLNDFYSEKICSAGKVVSEKYAYERALYTMSLMCLSQSDKAACNLVKSIPFFSLAKLESFYMKNNWFLEENFILKNAGKITRLKVSIVHGKQDLLCKPSGAADLHNALPNSMLYMTNAGHSDKEPDTLNCLKEIFSKII
ncbi:Proline iminopeptidase [uncultured archaeon]|nr:Proline iminopeptidase [uncultured archaeon]